MRTICLTHGPSARALYFSGRALARLGAVATLRLNDSEAGLAPDELASAAAGCDIIVASRELAVPAAVFQALPDLVAVCRVAVDIREIDVQAASRHGVLVTRASPGFAASVSEWVVGVMIDLGRGISRASASYHNWGHATPAMGCELRGASLGIVGYGTIGRYLASLGRALGMKLLVSDPYADVDDLALERLDLPTLLSRADFVVCLAAVMPGTLNLFDRGAFSAMKRGACFINASRGDLVDEPALLHALNRGHLGGCALDVGRGHDQTPSLALARHPLVIATPHIGGLTPQSAEHQAMDAVRQVEDLLRGRIPDGAVNAEHASRLPRLRGVPAGGHAQDAGK